MSLTLLIAPFKAIKRIVMPNEHSQFWIAQFFAIIATVLGVYLAASTGFWQAVKFEELLHSRQKFYLATSLEAELRDNNRLIEIQLEKIEKNNHFNHKGRPVMSQFVWGIMKESDATLALPPIILTQTRRYYTNIAYAFDNYIGGRAGSDRNFVKKILKVESQRIQEVITDLVKYREELYGQLQNSQMKVDMSIPK